MYSSLIDNVALLLTLTVMYGLLTRRLKAGNVWSGVFKGLLFGLVAVAGMLIPLKYAPGIIYDGRSIILAMAGLFGGGVVTLVSVVVAGTYRAYLGGNGIWAGLATIIACGMVGLALRRSCGNLPERLGILQLYGFGILVHIVMLACQLLIIPWPTGLSMISRLWLPVLLVFPFVTLLIGVSLGAEERRVQTERKLAESEALQSALIQNIPDMIWLKDQNGVYLSCNQRFERLLNAREADIVGKTDYDFFDRNQAEFFREYDRKAMAAGKPSSNEEWLTFADDGCRALMETIKTPMFDAEGKLIGVLGIARDITGRKESEEELKKHRDHLEELVNERTETLERKRVELEEAQRAMQSLLADVNAAKQELEVKVAKIERLNQVFVDRELRMVELKKQIKKLEQLSCSGEKAEQGQE